MSASFGFLSSFPPTQCGLATFTAALQAEIAAAGHETGVVRVLERPAPFAGPTVVHHMVHGQPDAVERSAAALNAFDVVVVQHEYGIYDGADGESVVDVLDLLRVPSIVVLHTVLVEPTRHQREVLDAIGRRASALVTMTATARQRLIDHYDVDDAKVVGDPARRRWWVRRPPSPAGWARSADADVGSPRTWQGHRAGHRSAAIASGPRSPAALLGGG